MKKIFRRFLLEKFGRQTQNGYADTEAETIAISFAKQEAISFANYIKYLSDGGKPIEQIWDDYVSML